jgi:MFS family permease
MGCNQTLTDKEIAKGLRNVIRDGLASSVMSTLTGSVFLVAFALTLGASELVIGLLATIPYLSNVIQIPTIYLVEKYRVRKSITMMAAAASRAFLLVIAVIPFVVPFTLALPLVLIALVLNSILASIGGCSWNSWMHDLLPVSELGRFFAKRMLLSTAISIPLALAAGFFITWWKVTFPAMELVGYSILFLGGFVAGLIGVMFIHSIPEPTMDGCGRMPHLKELVRKPFNDRNFKNLIIFLTSWNFAVNLALPFLTVYMLTTLGLSTSTVVVFSVISQISSLAFFRIWGQLSDRYSNKSVLRISGPIMIGCFLIWASTVLFQSLPIIVPVVIGIHILMGMATAGVNLVSGNIGLKLAPKGEATSYLASASLFSSLAAGTAPLLGGMVAMYVQNWEFFFLMAFVLGFVSLHRLTLVKEEGEVQEGIVVKELLVEMKEEISITHLRKEAHEVGAELAHVTVAHLHRPGGAHPAPGPHLNEVSPLPISQSSPPMAPRSSEIEPPHPLPGLEVASEPAGSISSLSMDSR